MSKDKADRFAELMTQPCRPFADDPGPDPNPECPRCSGLGCMRTTTRRDGTRAILHRFEYPGFDDKAFACSHCYPTTPQP